MENITECTALEFKLEYWIINNAIRGLVSVIFLYILLALLYHEIRLEKPRQNGLLRLPIEEKYRVLSKYTCISIAIAFLVYFVSVTIYRSVERIAVFIGSNLTAAETVCVVFLPIRHLAFTIGFGLVYLFLWLRQRVIYVHPSLKVLNNKYLSVFSFAVFMTWILFYISVVIVYSIKVQYRLDRKSGCIVDKHSMKTFNEIVFTWAAVSIFMQISLLSLFIYPILKQARWSDQQNNHNLMRRVKKAVVFASICLGTDIVAIVLYSFSAIGCVIYSATWTYGITLLINHLITIGCFDDWKKLLWPWNVRCCGVLRCESDSNRSIPAASFSVSQSQRQLTTIT